MKLVNYPIFNWPQLPYTRSKSCVLPTVRKVANFYRILVFNVSPDFVWKWAYNLKLSRQFGLTRTDTSLNFQ
jgi:hypothetical protein